MVMSCLVIVWIFLRTVCRQIHPDHQFFTPLYADMEIMVSPQIGMECPFSRHISALLYDFLHAVHNATVFFRNGSCFTGSVFFPASPCMISGFGTPEHLQALCLIVSVLFFTFLPVEQSHQFKFVYLRFFRFKDDLLAAYSERNFFLASCRVSR